jgi:hypothetical protein
VNGHDATRRLFLKQAGGGALLLVWSAIRAPFHGLRDLLRRRLSICALTSILNSNPSALLLPAILASGGYQP